MFNHEILHISGGTFIEQNINYELPEGRGVPPVQFSSEA